MDNTETLELPSMAALRAGDESAWNAFFVQIDGTVRAVVAWPKWHFDAHTREDVVQTIKVGIMQSLNRLHSDGALLSFVRKICINRCIDMLRKQLREQNRLIPLGHWDENGEWQDVDVAAGPDFDPVAELQRDERAAVLRAALGRLDEASQTLIRQFYVEGLSYRQLAELHGITVNTVGSRLSRCLDKLRSLLDRREGG